MLRPITLCRYLKFAAHQGLAVPDVLAGSDIDIARLDRPDYLIADESYERVVENLITLSGDRGVGLDVGLTREFNDFGLMGYASLAGRSQRRNLEALCNRYGHAIGMMTTLWISEITPGNVCIEFRSNVGSARLRRFFVEEWLGIFLKVGGDMNGVSPEPLALRLGYAAPPYAERYARHFACPIRFDDERSSLTLSRDWIEQPLSTSNDELYALCSEKLEEMKARIENRSPVSSRVLRHLRREGGPVPSMESMARRLDMTARTLSRHLQREGTNYSRMVDQVQSRLAASFVTEGAMPVKRMAERLGFDDVNAFRRAFKRWTGHSVSDFRNTVPERDRGSPARHASAPISARSPVA